MGTQESPIEIFMEKYLILKKDFLEANKDIVNSELVKERIPSIDEGKYVITEDIWTIQSAQTDQFMNDLLSLIEEFAADYKKQIAKFTKLFSGKNKSFSEFIELVLGNKHKELISLAADNDVTPDFITFVAIFAGYPFREAVAEIVETNRKKKLENHFSGFCPVCGHWPGMSYLVGKAGKRYMACISCGTMWQFKRVKCNFCLNENKDELSYLSIEGEEGASAYTCDSCHRYLKVIKVEDETINFPKETAIVDYMSTGYLDIASLQNEYVQESVLSTRFESPEDQKIELYYKGHTKH